MSEQETPRTVEEALTVEEAAAVESQRVYPSGPDHFVPYGLALRRYDFVAGATWQAARMPSVEQVAEVLAGHIACYGGSDDAYAVTCSCDRYGRPMGYSREGATVHACHAAERVVALWGAT